MRQEVPSNILFTRGQRGGIQGTQLIDSAILLDAEARALCATADPRDKPFMGVFDLATAFPSLDHQFVKACLAAVGLSPALRHFVDQLYMNNEQLVLHRGVPQLPSLPRRVCYKAAR